jgi:glutaconate CoA-transferase subunit A
MPTRTACGSDLFRTNPSLRVITCPFSGAKLTAVAAICPDVAVIHAQRADAYGNAHIWGNMGVTREACLASRHIIITAEEIVSSEVIRSDPNRIVVPGFRVSAVVDAPWGAYPSPVPGYYNRDHQAFIEYRNHSKTEAHFNKWLTKWIHTVSGLQGYIDLIGQQRLASLAIRHSLKSEPVDFGY